MSESGPLSIPKERGRGPDRTRLTQNRNAAPRHRLNICRLFGLYWGRLALQSDATVGLRFGDNMTQRNEFGNGSWCIDGGMVRVRTPDGTKSAQIGGMPPEYLAKVLMRELERTIYRASCSGPRIIALAQHPSI